MPKEKVKAPQGASYKSNLLYYKGTPGEGPLYITASGYIFTLLRLLKYKEFRRVRAAGISTSAKVEEGAALHPQAFEKA